MSIVAILGAGPVGASTAHALALRARVRDVRLIDEQAGVAAGKALDIRQSGSVDGFDTRLDGTSDVLAAAGADVIVVADLAAGGEWQGEPALALVGRLVRAGATAPFVFAGPRQIWLMEAAARELGVPADRLVGTSASALGAAARALVALETNGSGADAHVSVVGRPPAFVVAWSSATIGGSLVTDRVAAHRLLALAKAVNELWPPGPRGTGAATARVVEGLAFGSRQLQPALTIARGEFGLEGTAIMLPLSLGHGRILERVPPSMTPVEQQRI